MQFRNLHILKITSVFVFIFLISSAFADHGPGTSGGGVFTESAETLKPGQWSFSLRHDWTEFDSLSKSEIERADGYELIDRAHLTNLSAASGITENFQLGVVFGYYEANGARELEKDEMGDTEVVTYEPDGWTDLWLTGKYRLYYGPLGQFAIFGGIKAPVGEVRKKNSEGEYIEPAATSGSGAWDEMVGLAYTYAISQNLALDTSAQYTWRGEKYGYRLGNRLDAGATLSWRVYGDAKSFPQISLLGEANFRSVSKSNIQGEGDDHNTGGEVLFLAPGMRVRFCENMIWSISIQLPVVQNLNGDQVETEFRLTSGITLIF